MDRRNFIRSTGMLCVGFTMQGCLVDSTAESDDFGTTSGLPDESQIDAWLHVLEDGSVRVLTGKMDLGQGTTILMKQVAGEELRYGFSRYKNSASYCAVAAKVKVDLSAKLVRPLKMWAVLDAGEALNPDGLKNQSEGGMIQAASWTLKEEVEFDQSGIASKDWFGYPIIRFDSIPETEVFIIDRPEMPPLGAGEAAQGPAAAAVANAVYRACGQRIRELPLEKHLFVS